WFDGGEVQLSRGWIMRREEEHTVDWGELKTPWSERVAVSNHGPASLAGARINLRMTVRESVKTDTHSSSGDVLAEKDVQMVFERLPNDPTAEVVSYVMNQTPHYVTLEIVGAEAKPFGREYEPAAVEY